jgi:hypothetical protein
MRSPWTMRRPRPLPSLFLGLLAVAPVVLAASPSAPEDDAWRHAPRDLRLDARADGFSYVSERGDAALLDRIRGAFDLHQAALDYRFASYEPGNESALALRIQFLAVTEFRDADQDERLGIGDAVIHRVPLPATTGPTMTVQPQLPHGYLATARYVLPPPSDGGGFPLQGDGGFRPGSFTLRFFLTPVTTHAAGSEVAPGDVRLDFRIDGFPYQRNDTMLALELRVQSDAVLEPHADQLDLRDPPFRLSLAWSATAHAGVDQGPVGLTYLHAATPAAGAGGPLELLHAYPRSDALRHDGTVSVARAAAEPAVPVGGPWIIGHAGLYALGLSASGALVLSAALYRLRRAP